MLLGNPNAKPLVCALDYLTSVKALRARIGTKGPMEMELEFDEFRLRPFRDSDLDGLVSSLNDWRVAQWLSMPPYPYSDDDGRAWIAIVQRQHAGEAPGNFAIADAKGDLLGNIDVTCRGQERELGYWLRPDAWGRGVMTRAVARILRYTVEDLATTKIVATTDEANRASMRVLQKSGFRFLGTSELDTPTRHGSRRQNLYEIDAATLEPGLT